MQLVVDANVLFAALIKESATLELLFYDMMEFYAPEFVLEEFYKHKGEILAKTKRPPWEFDAVFDRLQERIHIIPRDDYRDMLKAAEAISPDPDDVPYLALAMKLNIPIWSNDKRLKEQDEVKIYCTKDFF